VAGEKTQQRSEFSTYNAPLSFFPSVHREKGGKKNVSRLSHVLYTDNQLDNSVELLTFSTNFLYSSLGLAPHFISAPLSLSFFSQLLPLKFVTFAQHH
jgi:hypothetical protein